METLYKAGDILTARRRVHFRRYCEGAQILGVKNGRYKLKTRSGKIRTFGIRYVQHTYSVKNRNLSQPSDLKIKVYLHEMLAHGYAEPEYAICFYSKEFGWMEYFGDGDAYSPLVYKNKKQMILESYMPKESAEKSFQKYGLLTYLGEL